MPSSAARTSGTSATASHSLPEHRTPPSCLDPTTSRKKDDYQARHSRRTPDRSFGKRAVLDYTFVPELEAKLGIAWYLAEGIQLRLDYNGMIFFNTIASQQPVSFNYGGSRPGLAPRHPDARRLHGRRVDQLLSGPLPDAPPAEATPDAQGRSLRSHRPTNPSSLGFVGRSPFASLPGTISIPSYDEAIARSPARPSHARDARPGAGNHKERSWLRIKSKRAK